MSDRFAGLLRRVETCRAASRRPRVIIGIAGPPGAGKTTLAVELVARLGADPDRRAAYLPMDGFHLADVELDRLGRRGRKGAPDTFDAAGFAALLGRIRAGEAVWAPAFDRTIEQPVAQSLPIAAEVDTIITEGNYLLLPTPAWRAVRSQLDEVWFLPVADRRRRDRLVARHVEFGKTPAAARAWVAEVDARNAALVAATEEFADLVLDDPNS